MDISREILQFLHYHPLSSRDEIVCGTAFEGSDATMKRLIASSVAKGDTPAVACCALVYRRGDGTPEYAAG